MAFRVRRFGSIAASCRFAQLMLALAGLAGCHATEERGAPVSLPESAIGRDFADPFVLREGAAFYAVATSARGEHIQTAMSSDLATWKPLPDALPRLPDWASRERGLTWAPSVLKRGERFVLYYTVRDSASGFQCISRASADQPQGPYVDDSRSAFICQVSRPDALCGSIDPSPFVDRDGTPYLYWKSDENSASCGTAPRVWVQRLADDGLALEGTPSALLQMDREWEAPIVEGPSMLSYQDAYFLFYSANWYASARYSVGYAKCQGPKGPCEKVTVDGPWMKSSGMLLGPGGQEFFEDERGQRYIAYHAWTGPGTTYEQGGMRSLRIQPLDFTGGRPVVY